MDDTFGYNKMMQNCKTRDLRPFEKTPPETLIRGFLSAKNLFESRRSRDEFVFRHQGANEGLGVFSTAAVFFASFFCVKRKKGYHNHDLDLLFFGLIQRKVTKERSSLRKMPAPQVRCPVAKNKLVPRMRSGLKHIVRYNSANLLREYPAFFSRPGCTFTFVRSAPQDMRMNS